MIALFAMPDDPAAIPAWLDRALLGPDLSSLVEELRVVHRPGAKPNLDAVLGTHRRAFLTRGFGALPKTVLRQLLRNPDLLLELPDAVYAEGSDFWFAEPLTAEEEARATTVANRVRAARPVETQPGRAWRWAERVWWAVAVAAAVVLTVVVVRPSAKPDEPLAAAAPGWGFNKIGELPRNVDSKTVYAKLADLADEWGKKPTDDRLALAKRLTEFRLGCSALQGATDLPLPPADVAWVKGRCREWATLIDGHLRDLDAGEDVPSVRVAAGETVARMAKELRDRS